MTTNAAVANKIMARLAGALREIAREPADHGPTMREIALVAIETLKRAVE